jgi:hypothetical protein
MNRKDGSKYPYGYGSGQHLARLVALISKLHRNANHPRPEQNNRDTNENALARYTWRLVIATSIIAIASVLNFGAALLQWNAMKNTDEATHIAANAARDAADAAKKSADTTVSLERPFFHIGRVDLVQPSGDSDPTPLVNFVFINAGKTAAIVREISAGCRVMDKILSVPPQYDLTKVGKTRAIVVPGGLYGSDTGTTSLPKCLINNPISESEYNELRAGNKCIIFFGFIKYESLLDFVYVRGFGAAYDYSRKFFVDINSDIYNYERIEKRPIGALQLAP